MKFSKCVILLVAAGVFPVCLYGQAGFLDINPDPVSLGMAGTGTVIEETPYAMWNNAAGAVLGDGKFQVGASYTM